MKIISPGYFFGHKWISYIHMRRYMMVYVSVSTCFPNWCSFKYIYICIPYTFGLFNNSFGRHGLVTDDHLLRGRLLREGGRLQVRSAERGVTYPTLSGLDYN